MHETEEDLSELQHLLDASIEGSGDHLRSAFGQDTRPAASEVSEALSGILEMHLAVVAADGAPLARGRPDATTSVKW